MKLTLSKKEFDLITTALHEHGRLCIDGSSPKSIRDGNSMLKLSNKLHDLKFKESSKKFDAKVQKRKAASQL